MSQFGYNSYPTIMQVFNGPDNGLEIGNIYTGEHALDDEYSIGYGNNPLRAYLNCAQGGWRQCWTRFWTMYGSGLTYWRDKPQNYSYVNGVSCNLYGIRRDANIYNGDASQYGTLHAGYQVAVWNSEGCIAGASHKDWMRIRAWRTSPSDAWVNGTWYVDTQIDTNSMSPTIVGSSF